MSGARRAMERPTSAVRTRAVSRPVDSCSIPDRWHLVRLFYDGQLVKTTTLRSRRRYGPPPPGHQPNRQRVRRSTASTVRSSTSGSPAACGTTSYSPDQGRRPAIRRRPRIDITDTGASNRNPKPDSDANDRPGYFDTTPTSHLQATVWRISPRPQQLASNGPGQPGNCQREPFIRFKPSNGSAEAARNANVSR